MGASPKPVCGSSIGDQPGEESADHGGRGFRVSRFRVSETPETDAVHVAAQEGEPTYPGSGARSGAMVSQ